MRCTCKYNPHGCISTYVLLQLRALPYGRYVLEPDRLSLFQGMRAGIGRYSESGAAAQPECMYTCIGVLTPIRRTTKDRSTDKICTGLSQLQRFVRTYMATCMYTYTHGRVRTYLAPTLRVAPTASAHSSAPQ